jgi:hypothetical protein
LLADDPAANFSTQGDTRIHTPSASSIHSSHSANATTALADMTASNAPLIQAFHAAVSPAYPSIQGERNSNRANTVLMRLVWLRHRSMSISSRDLRMSRKSVPVLRKGHAPMKEQVTFQTSPV